MRHRLLLTVVLTLLVLTAGCAGSGSDGPIRASGSPAAIGSDALAATGYERVAATERTFNATVHAEIEGDVSMSATQKVVTTAPVRVYRRSTDAGPAVVAVVSTPAVRPISNVAVYRDPFATLSVERRVNLAQSAYDVSAVSRVDARNVTMFGNETTLRTYEATAGDAPLTVHVVSVRHESDFVTVVVVHPRSVDERGRLQRLLAALVHPKK